MSDPTGAEHERHDDYLVAIVFDKVTRADEVLLNLVHLQQEGSLRLSDAVIAVKDSEGKTRITQTVDLTTGKGALAGGWWGLLLGTIAGGPVGGIVAGAMAAGGGALYGRLVDVGLDDGWIRQMADWLEPSTSVLLLLVADLDVDGVLAELRRYEGRLVTTTFPPEVRQRLEEALQDQLRQT